mgnify:CR=1 FL=1
MYAGNGSNNRVSRPAVYIALLGVAVGLIVMIVSVCVVVGFKRQISEKVQGFGADIQLLNMAFDELMPSFAKGEEGQGEEPEDAFYRIIYDRPPVEATDSLLSQLKKIPNVSHVQRFSTKIGMLKTDDDFLGVTFKGLDKDYQTDYLASCLVEGRLPVFSADESSQELLLSVAQARHLRLKTGDKVFAYYTYMDNIRARRYTITGLYETNLRDYDMMFAFTDLHAVNVLNGFNGDCVSGVEVLVKDFGHVDLTSAFIAEHSLYPQRTEGVRYEAFTIKQLAPSIFSWLSVLDTNVLMIIVIMFLVSSFTVVSGLLIIMLERIHTIATLKALGATNFTVRKIFIHFALMLVGKGVVIGNVAGMVLCLLQRQFKLISLDPSTYYIDAVPVEFDWMAIVGVNMITLFLSLLVVIGGSCLISISKPARALKYE